ncbi:MAG TPA: hypothetical protein VEL07_23605 [Planctomycetota bacterium]|nr:hypothetical protein [Planctomycetota bacterium]
MRAASSAASAALAVEVIAIPRQEGASGARAAQAMQPATTAPTATAIGAGCRRDHLSTGDQTRAIIAGDHPPLIRRRQLKPARQPDLRPRRTRSTITE